MARSERVPRQKRRENRADHDGAFRLLFGHERVFTDLLKGFVAWLPFMQLDLSTLKRVHARHVGPEFQQRENDVIWEVRTLDGERTYLYVMIEYQAVSEWDMALRVLEYVALFLRSLALQAEFRERRRVPLILPVVLYHGRRRWRAARNAAQLIEVPFPGLARYRPVMRYLLIDVWRKKGLKRGLKNVADVAFRLARMANERAGKLEVSYLDRWLRGKQWAALRRGIARWIAREVIPSRIPGIELPEVEGLREVKEVFDKGFETWSERWKAEGVEEGLEQGREEGREVGREEGRIEGRMELLVHMARLRFGEAPANAVGGLVGTVQSEKAIERIAGWLVSCSTGDALVARLREFQPAEAVQSGIA